MYGYGYSIPFRRSGGITPSEIGTIFDVQTSALANLNDFTISQDGTTAITLDGGYIKITGSPAASIFPLDNYIQYNGWVTSLETWTLSMDFIIKSYISSDQGIILGWRNDTSISTNRSDWYIHYRRSGSTATGDGYRYFNGTTTLTPNTFNTNPLTAEITPVVDNQYRMTLVRSVTATGARFTLTIADLTAGTSNSGSIDYTYANTSGQLDMSGSKFFISTTGGTHWVSRLKFETTEKKNPHYILVGDSMTAGYNASVRANHWVELLRSGFPAKTFTKRAAQGDKPATVVNGNSEVQLIAANKAIIWTGTNEVIASGSAVALASYATMYANLQASGVTEFIHINALPRAGSANINTFNAGLASAYSGDVIIDANTEANDGANNMKLIYSADTIHGNDLFYAWVYSQLTPYIS